MSKIFGNPTAIPFLYPCSEAEEVNSPGGLVTMGVAGMTLLWGDIVFRLPGGRWYKSLEASVYHACQIGVVVGGQALNYMASNDPANIGLSMSTIGQNVIVQTQGTCYANVDVTLIKLGDPLVAGQTTAGRISNLPATYAENNPGMVIKAGASALAKSANIFRKICGGVIGTNTAANLDTAALSGTVANGKFGLYAFRVASDGTTVTSTKSADADSLAELLWPVAGTAIVTTYGAVIVNPTGTGGFVGGTTALDDATVVPNAKYLNFVGRRANVGVALAAGGAAGTAVLIQLMP